MAGLLVIAAKLANVKSHIEDALNRKLVVPRFNKETRELEESVRHDETSPETIRKYTTDFSGKCAWYEVFSQLISLFPLLGILGTVAGLMINTRGGQDVFSGLNTALDTTFYGLIAAIVLKFIAVLLPANVINKTEIILDDYDKKLNNIVLENRLDAGEQNIDETI